MRIPTWQMSADLSAIRQRCRETELTLRMRQIERAGGKSDRPPVTMMRQWPGNYRTGNRSDIRSQLSFYTIELGRLSELLLADFLKYDNVKTINEVREDIGLPPVKTNEVVVTITADTSQFHEALDDVTDHIEEVADQLEDERLRRNRRMITFPTTVHPLSHYVPLRDDGSGGEFIPPGFMAPEEDVVFRGAPMDNTTPWTPIAPPWVDEINALNADITALQNDRETKQGTIDLMNRGLQSWQADYDELQRRYDSLHVCYDEQIDARSRLQESHRTLYVENEQLRDLRDELQGANDDLAERNAEMSLAWNDQAAVLSATDNALKTVRERHRALVDGLRLIFGRFYVGEGLCRHLQGLLANEVGN